MGICSRWRIRMKVLARTTLVLALLMSACTAQQGPPSKAAVAKHDAATKIVADLSGGKVDIIDLGGGDKGFYIKKGDESFTIPVIRDSVKQAWGGCKKGATVTLEMREGFDESWSVSNYIVPTCLNIQ